MKRFKVFNKKGGFVEAVVYPKSKLPKNCPKIDTIRLTCRNNKGNYFINVYIHPKEALFIASLLMRAWLYHDHKESKLQATKRKRK